MSPVYFGHKMADAIRSAGLPDDCVLHGLRKTTARILRELGVEASSMTGHLSAQMEREYARDAEQAEDRPERGCKVVKHKTHKLMVTACAVVLPRVGLSPRRGLFGSDCNSIQKQSCPCREARQGQRR